MNSAVALPKPRTQKLGAVVRSRLRNVIAAVTDRGKAARAVPHQYSFLSDCECPDDCLRDHENE